MSALYLFDKFAKAAGTALDSAGYATDSGHGPYTLASGSSLLCDGSGHAYETVGSSYEVAAYTPAVDQRLRFKVHPTTTPLAAPEQIGGFFRYNSAANSLYHVILDFNTSSTFLVLAQVNGTSTQIYQSGTLTVADGDTIDMIVTGAGPVTFTLKVNGATAASFTCSDPTQYLAAAGTQGLRHLTNSHTTADEFQYGPVWIGPLVPTFAATPGATTLAAGATTTITPANFTGTPTYTSSNPAVATVDAAGNVTAVALGTTTITAVDPTFADFTAGSGTITVSGDAGPPPATGYAFLSLVHGVFSAGLTTVGYAMYRADNTTYHGWTTSGVVERYAGTYGANIPVPGSGQFEVRWSVSNAAPFYSDVDRARFALDLAQPLDAPRALDSVADSALTVNDGLHSAIAEAAGRETVVGTAYTKKTPAGTTLRSFTLDSATSPTSRS